MGAITLIPPVLVIVIALTTKNILLALFVGLCGCSVLLNGIQFLNPLVGYIVGGVNANGTVLMLIIPLGFMLYYMKAGGGFKWFAKWARANMTTPKKTLVLIWVMSLLSTLNDRIGELGLGPLISPVLKDQKIAKHKSALIISSIVPNVASWLPFQLYFIFCSGMIGTILPGTDGASFYFKAIWFSFYTILTVILGTLVAFRLMPDVGYMKKVQLEAEAYASLDGEDDDPEAYLNDPVLGPPEVAPDKWALLLPLLVLIITMAIESFSSGGVVVEGPIWLAAIVGVAYPTIRKSVPFKDMAGNLMAGIMEQIPIFFILLFAFSFATALGETGFTAWVVSVFSGNFPTALLPLLIFAFCTLVSYSTGSLGSALILMLPITLPLASATGLNLLIAFGATYSGSQWGDQTSPVSDVTICCSGSHGLDPVDFSKSIMPYRAATWVICAIAFTICGAVM